MKVQTGCWTAFTRNASPLYAARPQIPNRPDLCNKVLRRWHRAADKPELVEVRL